MRAHIIAMEAKSPTIIGCKTLTPALDATAPVKNGKAAEPAWPVVDVKPRYGKPMGISRE